jgi:D-arginine dehydrogenase
LVDIRDRGVTSYYACKRAIARGAPLRCDARRLGYRARMSCRCDIVVIGAGIAGASFAYFASPHARVAVLEREAHPAMHSTGRSAAMYIESYGSQQVRGLTRASRAFLEHPPPGFSAVPLLAPRGALYIGDDTQRDAIDALAQQLADERCAVQRLSGREAIARVPVLRAAAAVDALLDPAACDIDVDALHHGFLRGARSRGATLHCDAGVRVLSREADGWRLETAARCWRADVVVDAAGAWADEVAALAGLAPLGIEPRRRSAFTFAPPAGVETRDWPLVACVDESFYFKPEAGVLLGSPANADPVPPHDVVPEELDIALGIHRIEQATTMTIRRPLRSWAGLRSFVADGDLVGGFAADAPSFFWLAAQGGYGMQTSVAMGAACAARVLGHAMPAWIADQQLGFDALAPRRGAQRASASRTKSSRS